MLGIIRYGLGMDCNQMEEASAFFTIDRSTKKIKVQASSL